jgi:hypothetical protein
VAGIVLLRAGIVATPARAFTVGWSWLFGENRRRRGSSRDGTPGRVLTRRQRS